MASPLCSKCSSFPRTSYSSWCLRCLADLQRNRRGRFKEIRYYSEKEVEYLQEKWLEGWDPQSIADQLSRPLSSIKAKAWNLGLRASDRGQRDAKDLYYYSSSIGEWSPEDELPDFDETETRHAR